MDSFPIYVSQPRQRKVAKKLYNPKYGSCVVKFVMTINFLGISFSIFVYIVGEIIFWTGLYFGLTYDAHIWNFTVNEHPFAPFELFLGGLYCCSFVLRLEDGHFSTCPQIVVPYCRNQIRTMSQQFFNHLIAFYRARVEHINGYIVRHNMWRCVYRGHIANLCSAMTITMHMSNVVLKTKIRYHLIGPYRHQ